MDQGTDNDAANTRKRKSPSKSSNSGDFPLKTKNQFIALRKVKRVKTKAGQETLAHGLPRSSVLSAVPSQSDIAEHGTATTVGTSVFGTTFPLGKPGSINPERKLRIEEVKRPSTAVSTFQPSTANVATNGEDLCLVALKANETICFQGTVLVAPIIGSFQVLGHTFTGHPSWSQSKQAAQMPAFYPCYSPKSTSLLVIEPIQSASSQPTLIDNSPDASVYIRQTLTLLERLSISPDTVAVIALRSLAFSHIHGVGDMLGVFGGLFQSTDLSPKANVFGIKGFHPIFGPQPNLREMKIPQNWKSSVQELPLNDSNPPVYCVVGGKNLGKSTFSRFLVNSLLNRHEEIAFLECDIGQSEFTSSGSISLHIVKYPLLGPPFTHLQHAYHSYYFGVNTPKNDPDFYFACIKELFSVYRNQVAGRGIPLVVNTHGWIKGMGFDLLVHFLAYIKPVTIFQLSVPKQSYGAGGKNLVDGFGGILENMIGEGSSGDFRIVNVDGVESERSKFAAGDHRMLSTLTYLYQNFSEAIGVEHGSCPVFSSTPRKAWWNFSIPMSARIPYLVPFSTVKLKFVNGEVPTSQTLYALNGTLVSLIEDRTIYEDTESDANNHLQIVPTSAPILPHMHTSLGLGLIRCIDPTQQTFHVVTPVPADQLDRVNMFVKAGGIDTPPWVLCGGYEVTRAHIPYTTRIANEGLGATMRRVRHNLLRRKGMKAVE